MKRAFWLLVLLAIPFFSAQAQETSKILDTYRRNFTIASLDVKIQILQDAASGKNATDMGPLYEQALEFVIDNSSLMASDTRFNQLASIAADQVGILNYTAAKDSLVKLFQASSDTQTLQKSVTALGVVAAGDADIIANLNHYLDTQNTDFPGGSKQIDMIVLSACIEALGKLGDPSSFPFLFSAMNLGYSDQVTATTKNALLSIKGDFQALLTQVIKDRPLSEKRLALQMALDSDKLTSDQKAQVAQLALDISLHTGAADVTARSGLRDMRFVAAGALGDRKWAPAAALLIEHLDTTIGEFDKGLADTNHVLDAITALGDTGTHEASVRLTQYLVLINSYTEKGKSYDEKIVTTILDALGGLADKVAFDDLMYTQYLNYPTGVKKAARAALDELKW
jgi:HEAT repeat protein